MRHDILIRSVKALNVFCMGLPFAACWYGFYRQHLALDPGIGGNLMVLALFLVLYCLFGRVYSAFQVSIKRISEIVISQCLAVLAADAVMLVITGLLTAGLPRFWPLLAALGCQSLLSLLWTVCTSRWYFSSHPPRRSVVVWQLADTTEALIAQYHLERKFTVIRSVSLEACLQDPSCLEGAETVFLQGADSHQRNLVLQYCLLHEMEVLVVPCLGDILLSGGRQIHLLHQPMLLVGRYQPTPEYLFCKRAFDILLSALGLIVLSPLLAVIAGAVHFSDGGPAIYTQTRLTTNGRRFSIHKFRSMRVDAEKDGVARLSTGENDHRITPVGRVLRRLRLDELPQLWDILRGDLSLVGPRPERPEIAAQYTREMPEFALRLQAKAGLTGYAQVYGKYNSTPYEKLQLDLMYIARPSLVQDAGILLATAKTFFMSDSTEGVCPGQVTASRMKAERE